MKTITSRHNPIVKRFRQAAAGDVPGLMLLDGAHLIEEATRAHCAVPEVACSPRGLRIPGVRELMDQLERTGAALWSVTDEVERAISPARSPSGIVALASRPAVALAEAFARPPQLVLVAVNVQDPGNTGAIVRAAEAGGATAAVFADASADPFGWKALRGSMGSAFRLPVVTARAVDAVTAGRAAGLRLIATTPRTAAPAFYDVDLRRPLAFLLGGEGAGLPEAVIETADEAVRIPMREPVESLNVAVAAALLVYEASRQRGRGGRGGRW